MRGKNTTEFLTPKIFHTLNFILLFLLFFVVPVAAAVVVDFSSVVVVVDDIDVAVVVVVLVSITFHWIRLTTRTDTFCQFILNNLWKGYDSFQISEYISYPFLRHTFLSHCLSLAMSSLDTLAFKINFIDGHWYVCRIERHHVEFPIEYLCSVHLNILYLWKIRMTLAPQQWAKFSSVGSGNALNADS